MRSYWLPIAAWDGSSGSPFSSAALSTGKLPVLVNNPCPVQAHASNLIKLSWTYKKTKTLKYMEDFLKRKGPEGLGKRGE